MPSSALAMSEHITAVKVKIILRIPYLLYDLGFGAAKVQLSERKDDVFSHFILIALDDNDKPVKVPRLILETEDERLAWEHGEERQRIRVERKKNHLDGV